MIETIKGLEFNIPSTSSNTVPNSSMSSLAFPITFFKQDLLDSTKPSKYPPHQGLCSKSNFHLILFSCKNENTEGSFDRLSKNLFANLHALSFSELVSDGLPLRYTSSSLGILTSFKGATLVFVQMSLEKILVSVVQTR